MPAFSAHMLDPGIAALPRDIEATRGTVAVVSLAVRGDATDAASERSLAVLATTSCRRPSGGFPAWKRPVTRSTAGSATLRSIVILVQEHRRRGDARRVVMFAVFFVVATLSLLESKQMGIGLAVPRRSSGPCCYPRR